MLRCKMYIMASAGCVAHPSFLCTINKLSLTVLLSSYSLAFACSKTTHVINPSDALIPLLATDPILIFLGRKWLILI